MRVSIFIAMSLLLTACSTNSETERYARLVEQWQGREIILPEVMTDVMTGDTIDLSDADFTILTYVDSAGCTRCRMKLSLWKRFANALDTISNAVVSTIMIVASDNIDEITQILSSESYDYPVYIDPKDKINQLNKFPVESDFQTVLLDHNNKVIAIGNPMFHQGIFSLYQSIISGKITMSLYHDAVITIDNNNINLGDLSIGEKAEKSFKIRNNSYDTIFIREIVTSCHCSKAIVPNGRIPPRSSANGIVIFMGDTIIGNFNNSVSIFYKGFDHPSILHISGNIYQINNSFHPYSSSYQKQLIYK